MAADDRQRCGQPTASGSPCKSPAGRCRFHEPKADPAPVESGRPTGGCGSTRPEDERLAVAMLLGQGKSAEDASRQTGIPASTIREWRRDARFAAQVRSMNEEMVTTAVYALGAVASKAVATLAAGMDGKAKPIQVRAADIVLSKLAPLREFELMRARLEELEALAGKDDDGW